jgi:hypothetical protein
MASVERRADLLSARVRATGNGFSAAGPPARNARRAVRASVTSMQFDPLLPFESWQALGAKIGRHCNASAWWLGDWLAFGQNKYGRRYKDAIAVTGLDYQTLRNYAVVARRFEPSRRRDDCSFQHHADVCALPDDAQDLWLELAARRRWSKRELRRRVRASLMAPARAGETTVVRITVESQRERRWREAAERAECGLERWIVEALDAATVSADSPF